MPIVRVGDLEISEDLAVQRRSWVAQRIGWVVTAILLAASLGGVFGAGGPLARGTITSDDGNLRVEYERFLHAQTSTAVRVEVRDAAVPDGELRLWIDREYLHKAGVQQVVPQPREVRVEGGRFVYFFPARGGGAVTFILKPARAGRLSAMAGVEGGPAVPFRQLVYP